jgi:hypothetical protein
MTGYGADTYELVPHGFYVLCWDGVDCCFVDFFKKMFTFYIMECRFLKLLFSWSRWNGIDCSPSSWQFVMVPHGQNVIVYLDFTSFIFFLKISHPLC